VRGSGIVRGFILAVVLSVAGLAGISCRTPSEPLPPDDGSAYRIDFGIIKVHDDGRRELVSKTNVIPRKLKDTGFRFGYTVVPADNDLRYYIYDISYMPLQPSVLTGALSTQKPGDAPAGVRTTEYGIRGPHYMAFWFDEGDPLGEYRVEVYIDKQLVKSFKFTVVEPK